MITAKDIMRLIETDPSLQPPIRWWNKMQKEIKANNPDYSQDRVDATIGAIWRDLSDDKKAEIRGREGKTYAPAEG